jgi:hypothetical protein
VSRCRVRWWYGIVYFPTLLYAQNQIHPRTRKTSIIIMSTIIMTIISFTSPASS